MSSDVALRVEGLGKEYTIRHKDHDHVTLAQAALHRLRHPKGGQAQEEFWALKDVSFEVPRGEVLGVIGHNGAGKSTLLKVLSRITPPTTGKVEVFGRIGSLLEVGTGFHPELTGRENVYLNGSILGMKKKEIDRQFDAIVDFSGVEQFLDTPVKRFSSGMYVRLAFAVAAHLDTEILLLDEVLAVGDAEFQQRCFSRVDALRDVGRTVFLVSHQLNTVASVCERVALFEHGRLSMVGPAASVLRYYGETLGRAVALEGLPRAGSGELRLTSIAPTRSSFLPDEPKTIEFKIERVRELSLNVFLSIRVRDSLGRPVAHCDSNTLGIWFEPKTLAGQFSLVAPWLHPGSYTIDFYICQAGIVDGAEGSCTFTVSDGLPPTGSDTS
jgi:lipopolysaccharide transport system ATP-binding protein